MATLDSGMRPAEVVACGRGRKHGSEDPPLQKSKDAGLKPGATNAEKKADPSPPFPRQSLVPAKRGQARDRVRDDSWVVARQSAEVSRG
jgi:hypothetical protein